MKKHLETITPFWAAVKQVEEKGAHAPKVLTSSGEIDFFGYQLAVHKFELALNAKGMKPRRNWKVTDLKNYYGLQGKGAQLVEQIKELMDFYQCVRAVLKDQE